MDKLRTKTVRHTLYKSSTATTKSEEEEGKGGKRERRGRKTTHKINWPFHELQLNPFPALLTSYRSVRGNDLLT